MEPIRSSVVKLMLKISQEKGEIHECVKRQILGALINYLVKADSLKNKGQINSQEFSLLQQLIFLARDKLQRMPSTDKSYKEERVDEMMKLKNLLMDSLQNLKWLKIQNYQQELEKVTYCMQNLEATNMDKVYINKEEEEEKIFELFLKLFIRSPVSSSTILEETMRNFDTSIKSAERYSNNDVIEFSKTVKQKLEEINKRIGRRNKKEVADLPAFKSSEPEEPHEYEEPEYVEIDEVKEQTDTQSEYLTILKEVEDKVNDLAESSLPFEETRTILGDIKEMLDDIKQFDSETDTKKVRLINRINGFVLFETMGYLREIKQRIDHYKTYAEQFPYHKSINLYKIKKDEISSLKQYLENTTDEPTIDERKELINHFIDEVLRILEDSVRFNGEIVSSLEDLDKCEQEINLVEQSQDCYRDKLKKFNTIRKKMVQVGNYHHRLNLKKLLLLHKLHKTETVIYSENYSKRISNKKIILEAYEKDIKDFIYSGSHETYNAKKKRIITLRNATEIEKELKEEDLNLLLSTFDDILDISDKSAEEIKITDEIYNELKSVEIRDLTQIRSYRRRIETVAVSIKKAQALAILDQAEAAIMARNFKTNLSTWEAALEDLKQDIKHSERMDTEAFKSNITRALCLMESIKDIPEGDSEVDSKKKSLLEEVSQVLEDLDQDTAYLIARRKGSKNIPERHDYIYDINLKDVNISKESFEFVDLIYQKCVSLKMYVKYYVGSNCSTDYYFLEGALIRLLEELDSVACRDKALATKLVETMEYIKCCMKDLELTLPSELPPDEN